MNKMKQKILTGLALTTASVGSAMAAVPVTVTTAISDAGADAATVGAAVLVVIVGIYAFKLLRKAL